MKSRLFLSAALALASCAAAAPTALAAGGTAKGSARYYLALGDSLSVGYQPNAAGVAGETKQGYTNDVFAVESKRIKRLRLVEMGCPHDTTTSMLTGKGNESYVKRFHCDLRHGSQLKAAVAFLKAHHKAGEVPLITIDIGANDVEQCASAGALSAIAACVTNGENAIKTNTPKILNALKAAAPKRTKFVALNLYDPLLGGYFSTNPNQKLLATASVSLAQGVNGDIESADTNSGFKTADIADAFQTYNQSPTVAFDGQMIPVDVAYVCSWTWACTTPPVGPNIHANPYGYAVMASQVEKTAGRLK